MLYDTTLAPHLLVESISVQFAPLTVLFDVENGSLQFSFAAIGSLVAVGRRMQGAAAHHSDAGRFTCRLCRLSCGLILLAVSTGAFAQAPPPRVAEIEVGFDGRFKVGSWSPIAFSVTGPAGTVITPVVRASDPDGNPTRQPLEEVELPEEGTLRIEGLFRSGRLEAPLQVELRSGSRVVDTVTLRAGADLVPMRQHSQLWLMVGEQPPFRTAAQRWNGLLPEDVYLASRADLAGAFPVSEGLEGLDVIVLPAAAAVSGEASERIRRWVQRGGRLVIAVGDGVDALAASPLHDWLPLRPGEQGEVRNFGGLNTAVPGSETLRLPGSVPAAQLDPTQGRVLAPGLAGPLLMRSAYGVGQVTMLAVALDRRPLSTWEVGSQTDFAALLADVTPPWRGDYRRALDADAAADLSPTGVSDLQTQLVHSLDRYENVPRSSHWVVMGWISLFLLLIGPIDYLVLHRFLERPQWTWVTLPVWIVVASLWATTQAGTVNQQPLQGRQMDIVDVDASAGLVRARSWMNFYSPQTQRTRIASQPARELLVHHSEPTEFWRTGWIERPESGFRGMYRPGGTDTARPEYSLSSDRRVIENLPTQIWSTGSVVSDWESSVPGETFITAELVDAGDNRVRGTLRHRLPGELSEWFLAYGGFAYFPGSGLGDGQEPLRPGEVWDLTTARSNILRGVLVGLTQRSIAREGRKGEDALVSREDYNPLARDPFMLARMITFHDAAGSTGYTGLLNQSLRELDLSHLLRLNRAVLYGRMKHPATVFEMDGSPVPAVQQDTFVRVIIPVERIFRTGDAPPDPGLLQVPR